ncbi:hypothetical protein [Arthrobacter sp. NPDC090010]|uniref:hypothetical protein n=1 Tax=Arthrobacter sp. NPDC090010 TaxID=3363942 RepID=UPI00382D0244
MTRPLTIRGAAVPTLAIATLFGLGACSLPGAPAPGPSPAPDSSVTPHASGDPANPSPAGSGPAAPQTSAASHPAGPSGAPSPAADGTPTFGPDSTTIHGQETVQGTSGKTVSLRLTAPADTRFLIGTGSLADSGKAIPCTAKIMDTKSAQAVNYEVSCPWQGEGQKLYSVISYEEFDYTFMKSLN